MSSWAWCRLRVIVPTWDRTLPTLIGCLDRAMRAFGGAPTYWLTDNERTVTIDHVAGVAVRHPLLVQVGSAETLLDDAIRIARHAGAADVWTNLEIWPDMIHAWHLWAAQLEDGRRAIAAAGAFIRTHL